jgi:hypothetical protein
MLSIITFGVGLISGMYIVTQLEKGISNNINRRELIKNIDKLDKKKKDD